MMCGACRHHSLLSRRSEGLLAVRADHEPAAWDRGRRRLRPGRHPVRGFDRARPDGAILGLAGVRARQQRHAAAKRRHDPVARTAGARLPLIRRQDDRRAVGLVAGPGELGRARSRWLHSRSRQRSHGRRAVFRRRRARRDRRPPWFLRRRYFIIPSL